MKLKKHLAALALALVMALSLTACSPRDMLSNMIIGVVDLLGLRPEGADEEDEAEHFEATAGGSVTFPEGMDTNSRFPNEVHGDTLYIAFNGIMNRSSDYFVAASDSVTITAYATTESPSINESRPPSGSFRTTRPRQAMWRVRRSTTRPAAIATPRRFRA